MRGISVVLLGVMVGIVSLGASALRLRERNASDEVARVQNSIAVLNDLTGTPDKAIPKELLENAQAIVVIPTLLKGGFVVGGKHGRGVVSVRRDAKGEWSPPAFVTMNGGSIGWQIGGESIDLVMLVMNRKGVDDLLADKFTVGGNASIAAGPVGRTTDAATDAKMSSEILAYSRARGLFAGASFEGAALRPDKDANQAFYARPVDLLTIVNSKAMNSSAPETIKTWSDRLRALTNGSRP